MPDTVRTGMPAMRATMRSTSATPTVGRVALAASSQVAARRLFAHAGLHAAPKADGSAGFVQHVNGLVRQQAIAHMPGRQIYHGLDGGRAVPDLVEVGIALFKPLKDGERHSSTFGSLRSMRWNRRARARSFSKWLRNSS